MQFFGQSKEKSVYNYSEIRHDLVAGVAAVAFRSLCHRKPVRCSFSASFKTDRVRERR